MTDTTDAPAGTPLDPYRLPRTAVPSRYDLTLHPDLDAGSFAGTVVVTFDVVGDQPLAEVVLNAIDLDIHRCTFDAPDGNTTGETGARSDADTGERGERGDSGTGAEFRLESETERLFVTPPSPLAPGRHTLAIGFDGVLNDKLRGFYRSTYRGDDGVERVIATTQMQATDCRRAFPCWDEPDFKAVFGVTLVVDRDLLAISNSPEEYRREIDTGANRRKVEIHFADTMVMSTYLVAFVVGPLETTDTVDVDGIALRLVHVPGKGHLTAFGLDVGAFCLQWFQDYYGIEYPGDKVDLVALPDFAAGAMENLGCITFRENLLLVDPATSTQHEQELVADVVAHELAHMWFGDLVTMRWWNGIWLNEAFATFMELAACDAYRPDWNRWTSFGLERSVAFETDSLSSTRAVEYDVRSPADCEGMFDVLTYQKGGALLRMLEQYLGADRFREGVSHYLRAHAYGNTETSDLWDAIESTSGEPVRRLMDSWIWQPGYPLVTARLENGTVVLDQAQFSFAPDSTSTTRWIVPVTVRHGERVERLLLEDDPVRLRLDDPGAAVIVNAGGHGFFRVAYDDELRSRLGGATLATLDTLERYNLVDDAWNAVVAGRLSAAEYLDFVEGFADESEYAVWQSIVAGLRGMGRLLDGEPYAALQRRVAALVAPVVERLGDPTPDEDDLTGKLRGLLVGVLAVLGDHLPTQDRCRALFEAASGSEGASGNGDAPTTAEIDPELLAAATTVVAATGGEHEYEGMLAGFRNGATPQEQLRHLYALAEFDDPDLLARTCELAMSGEVKTQNAPFLLRLCIANRHHGPLAWAFVREHWAEANERFPSNTIVRMVESVKLLNLPEQVAEVQAFFAEHPITQAVKTMEQMLERQRVNAELRRREHEALTAALR